MTRSALITGASSGIGRVFARELARQGYTVTCVARSRDTLDGLVRELGAGHRALAADLGDPGQLQAVVDDIGRSGYSLLVNNAGYGLYGRFERLDLERQETMMFVNMNALVRLSHAFLRKAKPGDSLINVSSTLGLLTYPGGAVYAGSKAFVANFSESLWYEFKERGVYIMALLPGVTRTGFFAVATGGRPGADKSGPSYPPEVIVRDALTALRKRKKPTVISGPIYRVLTFLSTRLASRKRMINIMGKRSSGLNWRER